MNIYKTLEGQDLPLTQLDIDERSSISYLERTVHANIKLLTRTQLQMYWLSFAEDHQREFSLNTRRQKGVIETITNDLSDRIGIAAGMVDDIFTGPHAEAKEWTGEPQPPIYVFYSSRSVTDRNAPVEFKTGFVPVIDSEEGCWRKQVERKEQTCGRMPVGVFTTDSEETNAFLEQLSAEYGNELDVLLRTVMQMGYEFGIENGWTGYTVDGPNGYSTEKLQYAILEIPLLRQLMREVGDDIHLIVRHAVSVGLLLSIHRNEKDASL